MKTGSPAKRLPVSPLPSRLPKQTDILFTDVDDTLTWQGQLPVEAYTALHQLREAGIEVVPVTGGCAGWCDCLIKTWPISTIIGENGAFYMEKDTDGIVQTHYLKQQSAIADDLLRLKQIGNSLQQKFPLIGYTQDQPFRLTDIAFDIGQTVTVDDEIARQATAWLIAKGLQARMSSIHINVWLGDHSKALPRWICWSAERFPWISVCLSVIHRMMNPCSNILRFQWGLPILPGFLIS